MDNRFFDSLYEGDSPKGIKLGMGLTSGDFWPRVESCSVLYRGESLEAIDFAEVLAVEKVNADMISPPDFVSHSNGITYYYLLQRINHCGHRERTLSAATKIAIDINGDLAQPEPANVLGLRVKQIQADKIELVWWYWALGQKVKPSCFKIYYDAGTGQVDYQNPIAIVSWQERVFYQYTTDSLQAARYIFAVKAQSLDGIEDESLASLEIEIKNSNPDSIDIVSVESF